MFAATTVSDAVDSNRNEVAKSGIIFWITDAIIFAVAIIIDFFAPTIKLEGRKLASMLPVCCVCTSPSY